MAGVAACALTVVSGCDSAPEEGMPMSEEEDMATDEAAMDAMTAEDIGDASASPP